MSDNYVVYHLHSDLSSLTTTLDSVTKYKEYIDYAKELGMKALGFSEHGVPFEWWHKKTAIEAAGMKFIHAVEAYVTEDLKEKRRDNYHCVLIAKNFDGVLELNRLISGARNRDDGHFYYMPRITMDELFHTSENILVTTACIGGLLWKTHGELRQKIIDFCATNRDRCFFEIQHHNDGKQIEANKLAYKLSQQYDVPLIAGTDTHALNEKHVKGREILQRSKNIHFDDEDNWDLTFKTYDELVVAYEKQNALPRDVFIRAIENTNMMADMIEPFIVDCGTKYPHIYDYPVETFKKKINQAYKNHPYVKKRYTKDVVQARVREEMAVYEKTKSIDFMLLETYIREWERSHGIHCGPGRGSVSGSFIAYLLGITEMDSIKFNLNFFRFANPDRVSNADIDTDYASKDRDKVKEFLLKDHMDLPQIQTCEIVTFNTIAMKGAIKDVARALGMKDLQEVQQICNAVKVNEKKQQYIDQEWRSRYPELFEYVDIVNGTIVSMGTHPSGVLVSDRDIASEIGLCSTSKSKYPVSILNMKELDDQMWVKLDALGLDNLGLINETCKLLHISPLTPDSIDLEDEAVWRSIREDTTMIFQWESDSAQSYLERFMSDETIAIAKAKIKDFTYLKWLSFGNGLIRPACASFRDNVANGEFYDNGFASLNEFLSPEAGRIAMQETVMKFLVKFCGYSNAESDNVRRAIAKKKGTEKLLPEIETRFIKFCPEHYDITEQRCAEVIKPFLQIILDASDYGFSWNHSDAYSAIGYMCGYLRYYHPKEFLTAALNIFADNEEKTKAIISYANKIGITVSGIKFGHSGTDYSAGEGNIIYKGMASIKYLNRKIAKELQSVANKNNQDFCDVLYGIKRTSVDARQLEILIKLGFFSEYGNENYLLKYVEIFNDFFDKKQISKALADKYDVDCDELNKLCEKVTEKTYSKFDPASVVRLVVKSIKVSDVTMADRFLWESEHMGYIQTVVPDISPQYAFVQEIESKYKNPTLTLYRLCDGTTEKIKVKRAVFDQKPISAGSIIKTIEKADEGRWFKKGADWQPQEEEHSEWFQGSGGSDFWQHKTETEPILKKWSICK